MDNPLGMHILCTIPPRVFKGKLARFAPQFSGYNQHDSQVSFCKFSKFFIFVNVVK
ncbi:putative ubiquitinyl hydrolase 1 [Lupinus albus]|uniref:Putative ubiquitinyl hydrolase 1 n=1 Tax=Lupinus albus TaxID=3870 RepID=A0A6A4NCK3_LUPAL|nr:putative ubiquitinyl hydrolase 1 [Lupinus albus]